MSIERLTTRRKKLKVKRDDIAYSRHWTSDLVIPLARTLLPITGLKGIDTAGPFGMGNRFSVYLTPEEGQKFYPTPPGTIHFTVEPNDLSGEGDKPILCIVDYSVTHSFYPPGSMGEMNGFNHKTKPIPEDITPEALLALVRECNFAESVEAKETETA